MTIIDASEETTQTEGEGPEGSDKPPHGDIGSSSTTLITNHPKSSSNSSIDSALVNGDHPMTKHQHDSISTVPLPPAEAGAYEKQPGHPLGSLDKLLAFHKQPNNGHITTHTLGKSNHTASPASSPTASESDWGSQPSTRPPSQAPSRAPSRAPSMSAGTSGNKIIPPHAASGKSKHPESPVPRPGKPASVHSDGGGSGHKFNLKDLLASTPKLSRKSSQRSTGSSRKSDSDFDGGGGKSIGGDSAASLTKKYGVCQKVAIGKGATSVVRLAHKWDRTEEKLYAVKEFRKRRKTETEKEYVKKLTAEFCISSTLHHINIVETVDLIQDESQHWCEVMEFCPGGDLYAAIKKGGMSPSEVECCFRQILNGVLYLHSQGVAHRDIKPENLFFDTKGHLKIGDYGASTVYRLPWEATIHMSTGLCGSEPYIAPEQFLGKPYDARLVDIWACGIVYYCLHFQELPWRAAQPSSDPLYTAYAAACANPSPAVSACPPTINNLSPRACRSLIRKMLEPDPALRSNIEDVVNHSWVKGIEVCHEVEQPKHIHVHARTMGAAQLREMA
ncbi:kinase-like domain-containing protein [Infundibulicybe gibba]|nr:kinase-like domain-containing protein [Infundibulicybe gibba]